MLPYQSSHCQLTPQIVSKVLGTLLNDYLGDYIYPQGHTRKAVSIGKPIKNAEVKGLELIVPFAPKVNNQNETWSIYIIDKQGNLEEALFYCYQVIKANWTFLKEITILPETETVYGQLVANLDSSQLIYLAVGLNLMSQED